MDASELKHENFGKGWVGRPIFSNSKNVTVWYWYRLSIMGINICPTLEC